MTDSLVDAAVEILESAPAAALLRETTIGPELIDHGDIDVLVAQAALDNLLDAVDRVAVRHGLHYRLRRSGPKKVGVELLTLDMAHSIKIDLWLQLWQIFGGRSYLTYEDIAAHTVDRGEPLPRLDEELEAIVYLQHLAVKGRDPSAPENSARLSTMRGRGADDPELHAALERCADQTRVDDDTVDLAEDRLRRRAGRRLEGRGARTRRRRLPSRAARRRLEGRALDAVALVGVDGCGKTSLGENAAAALDRPTLLAKTAYRRSWLFRGIYKGNRLTTSLPYESIDERLVPLTHLVAARRLPGLVAPGTFIDRYLPDFVVVGRKTTQPRWSRLRRLLTSYHRPCRIVHVRASWATIVGRKDEISEAGHTWYDTEMRHYYCALPVYDYLAFRNDGALEPAAAALVTHLDDPGQGPPQ